LHIYWFLSIYVFISIFNLVVLDVFFAHHVAFVSTADFELWQPDFYIACVVTTRFLEVLQTDFNIIVHGLICNLTWLVRNQNYEINVVFNRVKYQYFFKLSTCTSENICLSDSHEIIGFSTNFK
jgi:hypothetical protein